MNNKKHPISIFTTIWGHKSIAVAVKNALEDKYNAYLNLIKPTPLSAMFVNVIYTLFPSFNKIPYKIAQNPRVDSVLNKYNSRSYRKIIEQFIKEQKPEVVISTYFPFNSSLVKLSEKYKFTLISILANPKTFFPSEIIPNAINFVFDDETERECLKVGILKNNIVKSGWFVRNDFQKFYNKTNLRKSINLKTDIFTITVIGGSQGMVNILKIIPAYFKIKKRIQVVFICGKNKKLFKLLNIFKSISKFNSKKLVKIIIKNYVDNIHTYMQASDLVIGKAGPNLLFETVATHTPFFAISHISGQEDGNLEIIRKYNIGFVEENPIKVVKLARNIINDPRVLKRFHKPLEKLAQYNKNSYQILRDKINKTLLQKQRHSKY